MWPSVQCIQSDCISAACWQHSCGCCAPQRRHPHLPPRSVSATSHLVHMYHCVSHILLSHAPLHTHSARRPSPSCLSRCSAVPECEHLGANVEPDAAAAGPWRARHSRGGQWAGRRGRGGAVDPGVRCCCGVNGQRCAGSSILSNMSGCNARVCRCCRAVTMRQQTRWPTPPPCSSSSSSRT